MLFLYLIFGAIAAVVTTSLVFASFLLPSFSWWWGGSIAVAIWAVAIAFCRSTTTDWRRRSSIAFILGVLATLLYTNILWIRASQDDPSIQSAVAERMERLYKGVSHDRVPLATREYERERERRQQTACNTPPKSAPSPGHEWRHEPPCSWLEALIASASP